MHEREKAKLIRHHAKRLSQLGADDALVAELAARLSQPPKDSSAVEQKPPSPPDRIRKFCPAKARRGALGFRARQTRIQEYSVKKEQSAGVPRRRRPPSTKNKNLNPD